jgi:membrane-bound inhibitor of C-type lysozyme
MTTPFPRYFAACAFALAAFGLCATATAAESHPKAEKVLKSTKGKKAKAKKAVVEEEHEIASTEPDPDITDTVTVDYSCELGNKVTIYTNEGDTDHMALRWKKRLHRMTRVGTSTGASRFENTTFNLVWIGIPAKSMLLDSKANRQLANECKNADQNKPLVSADAAAPGKS